MVPRTWRLGLRSGVVLASLWTVAWREGKAGGPAETALVKLSEPKF